MEGKTVILNVLILGLVLAQVQVDAKSCCPSTTARNIYNTCRLTGASRPVCASLSGCKIQPSAPCLPPNTHETLQSVDPINAYCKLGCASSVCNPITALLTSGEDLDETVEKCITACSEFCAKGSIDARAIA